MIAFGMLIAVLSNKEK
ncbi:hypothetical protein [Bacillus sp. KRF7]|nr:hypothetical protein [Bacillus sp. KRF7]MCF7619295.1 hypothetical protein [Bacillus sonorensis]MCY7855658.1 hypothetical protein [Bacillus sonorensis]MCY8025290.1 hypothetical protein [Bacillus sonorensis]MCY8032533.1 hypothetical protein [Bacillus sonorensis]MCY8087217.1 hypothetical protein [Bacillus sonorensis]